MEFVCLESKTSNEKLMNLEMVISHAHDGDGGADGVGVGGGKDVAPKRREKISAFFRKYFLEGLLILFFWQ